MQKQIRDRKDINPKDQWDLTLLFQDDKSWKDAFTILESEIHEYNSFKGRLSESILTFKNSLDFNFSVYRKIEALYVYAHLKNDEDKTNQTYLGMYQQAFNLYSRISELASFLDPEIQSIPTETMNRFLQDTSMQDYRFYLEKILKFKPHTLSPEIEQILAMNMEIAQTANQVFSQLDNADLKFGSIQDENGNSIELSHGNFSTFLMNPSREIRKNAFFTYYKAYNDHKNTMAATLYHSNKKDSFYAKVRKFSGSRRAALFRDDVPDTVYDNLLESIKNNLQPLFKYLDFRRKVLGVEKLHFYDTYTPLIGNIDFQMSYEEAVDTCIQALEPLGKEYLSIMKEGLLNGWVDRYENRGKRSGAYSSGCYDSPPYILLNYEEKNINSLYTLIHEAGHSMHSYYSKKYQPYPKYEYTIFVAEVASTFNETLLSTYLTKLYQNDPEKKAFILNREIDNIRATLYRQTMFAEFEKITHEIVEANKPLTLEVIENEYKNLLLVYFGNALEIDKELTLECLRIPHFYSAFYVYKYATGLSAAIALANKVQTEGESARDRYLDFLKLGGSKFPIEELIDAGVDMNTSKPIEKALQHFSVLVDDLIENFAH
ncbi:MAG: oligoendopeptidase F [Leptospiraceae bacterium]|nr:oligoendopeptidase F [Leptospiraceae bacterium]